MTTTPTHAHSLELWSSHLLLASNVVREYCFRLDLREDAAQEVKLALWEATMNWNEAMENTFSHYAWLVMRRKLLIYLTMKASEAPRLSRKEKHLMTLVREHMKAGQMISCAAISEMSTDTGISAFRINQLIGFWYASSVSISAACFNLTEEQFVALDDEQPDVEQALQALDVAMEGLSDRERTIIEARYLKDPKTTLHTLASQYGVSAVRIRQIEMRSIEKLSQSIKAAQEAN